MAGICTSDVYHGWQMEDLAGTAVRVTPERHRADEWAVVLAAGCIRPSTPMIGRTLPTRRTWAPMP